MAGDSPFPTILSACLFLYVGFWLNLYGTGGNPIYEGSVAAFTWGARIVGIGLLITAGLVYFRLRIGMTLDLAMAVLAAAGCFIVGAIWIAFGDMQGILLLLFAALNGSAAKTAWLRWKHQRAASEPNEQ